MCFDLISCREIQLQLPLKIVMPDSLGTFSADLLSSCKIGIILQTVKFIVKIYSLVRLPNASFAVSCMYTAVW